jgi:hypothetical protein
LEKIFDEIKIKLDDYRLAARNSIDMGSFLGDY